MSRQAQQKLIASFNNNGFSIELYRYKYMMIINLIDFSKQTFTSYMTQYRSYYESDDFEENYKEILEQLIANITYHIGVD